VVVRAPRLPRLDETLRGEAVDYRLGGKGGNQALAAARAGARVAFAGRIGGDDPGARMRAELVAAGVDVAGLQQGDGASGMSVAITTADGGYGAVIVSGETLSLDAAAVRVPEGCRMILAQNEVSAEMLGALPDMPARRGRRRPSAQRRAGRAFEPPLSSRLRRSAWSSTGSRPAT
jgi:ribokinase